jgi:hypothetical protein
MPPPHRSRPIARHAGLPPVGSPRSTTSALSFWDNGQPPTTAATLPAKRQLRSDDAELFAARSRAAVLLAGLVPRYDQAAQQLREDLAAQEALERAARQYLMDHDDDDEAPTTDGR